MNRAVDVAVRAAELVFAVGVVAVIALHHYLQLQGYLED